MVNPTGNPAPQAELEATHKSLAETCDVGCWDCFDKFMTCMAGDGTVYNSAEDTHRAADSRKRRSAARKRKERQRKRKKRRHRQWARNRGIYT